MTSRSLRDERVFLRAILVVSVSEGFSFLAELIPMKQKQWHCICGNYLLEVNGKMHNISTTTTLDSRQTVEL